MFISKKHLSRRTVLRGEADERARARAESDGAALPQHVFDEMKAYVGFAAADEARLRSLWPIVAPHTQRVVVDRDRTIGFMGEAMRVYSTPSMVLDVERTCKDFLAQYLAPEQNSVGMRTGII